MEKFIPYEKLSKKKKRDLDAARRGSWGGLSPVTRRPEDPKAYKRKKTRIDFREDDPGQTVDKPMRLSLDTHGGIVKGGGYALLHVQSVQKWGLWKVPIFAFRLSTSSRQPEDPDRLICSPYERQ